MGLVLFLGSRAWGLATATISGPIGLIEVPTAFTLEERQFYFGSDYSSVISYSHILPSNEKKELWQSKFNLVVFRDLELGVVGESGREGVFVNLKYYLINPVVSGPVALALGAENLTSYSRSSIYMVASKRFNQYLSAHFGFNSEFPPGKVYISVMGGIELKFCPEFSAVVDYRAGDNLSRLNAGVKFLLFDLVTLNLSGLNLLENQRGYSAGAGILSYF